MFCGFEIGGKCFPNQKARVHLSGDKSLKTGLISTVCSSAPDDIKTQFSMIEKKKECRNRISWLHVNVAQSYSPQVPRFRVGKKEESKQNYSFRRRSLVSRMTKWTMHGAGRFLVWILLGTNFRLRCSAMRSIQPDIVDPGALCMYMFCLY